MTSGRKGVVCIFSANYYPNLGGVERYTDNIAKKLAEYGYKVIIVTSNNYRIKNHEFDGNVEIFRIPCFNLLGTRFPVAKINKEYKRIINHLDKVKIDFIIVQTRFYVHSYIGTKYAKKRNVPSLVIEHGTNHFTVNNKFWDFLGEKYEHIITNMVKHNCSDFYGVSKACNGWLKHFKIKAKGVFYNAIDIDNIKNTKNNKVKDYRGDYSLENDLIITYTGRLVKEKGVQKLIEAVERFDGGVKLFVAGDGDLFDSLSKQSYKNTIMLGRIDFTHIISLLIDSDVFCLPTDYPEGFPTSTLEAAACNCYIITTNAGGSGELIADDNYGIVLKNNTADEIYASICKVKDMSKDERKKIVNNCYNRVVENFSWDITSKKIESVISKRIG